MSVFSLHSSAYIGVRSDNFRMDPPIFDGTGDLLAFLDHVHVWATLKGYEGERKAVALASRLRDGAFGNFRRLSVEEQSKFDSIAASLKEEFPYGSASRLQAVAMLRNLRWNRSMEPIAAFGHEPRGTCIS